MTLALQLRDYITVSLAFVKRDFIIESSYKMGFFIKVFQSIAPIVSFYFLDKLIGAGNHVTLQKYGGEYFPFVLIGLSFSRYFQLASSTFSENMRRAQLAGCLEALLCSQTSPKKIVFDSSLYSFISAGVQLVSIMIVGLIIGGSYFSQMNIMAALVIFMLSLFSFLSIGILSASSTMIFKQGEPIGFVFGSISGLVGGAFFPIEVMPDWLEGIAHFIPLYHSLDALRLTILQGYSINMVMEHVIFLGVTAFVLFPLSLYLFEQSIEYAKRKGTLGQY